MAKITKTFQYGAHQVTLETGEIARQAGGAVIVKMDADANPVTPAQYRVTGLPTMNLYYQGELVRSIVGVRPKSAILTELSEFVA